MLIKSKVNAVQSIDFETFFQHDEAPPYYSVDVRQYLDTVFPLRWIGRRGVIEWPVCSPYLTPLDYLLRCYLKDKVNEHWPTDLNDLRHRIAQEPRAISREYIQNGEGSFYKRLG
jgi:hypothetical protein